jgi:hypothetical protein
MCWCGQFFICSQPCSSTITCLLVKVDAWINPYPTIALPRRLRPNQRVQPTPQAASKIAAILKVGFVPIVIAIYLCGAADAQHVGPRFRDSLSKSIEANIIDLSFLYLTLTQPYTRPAML